MINKNDAIHVLAGTNMLGYMMQLS